MNEKDVKIHEFVKKNIVPLTSNRYNQGEIKRLRYKFFIEQNRNKFGNPPEKDIAREVISYLVKGGKLKDFESLKKTILRVPFLKNHIADPDSLEDLFIEKKSLLLTPEDLSKINREEYREQVENKLVEQIVKEKSEIIDNQIDEKKKELDAIPSILDIDIVSEPLAEENSQEESKEWWQILSLSADPFPRQEGLNQIPEDIYDKVIYKNELIKDYIERIESNKEKILNKGVLILGNFGTGKTTFFDYLELHLIRNKICPIRMTFAPKADVITYNSEFESKLFLKLKEIYSQHHSGDYTGPPNNESSKNIMKILQESGWSFMIIIDDLHKHAGNESVVLRFLGTLQIVKDDFIRSGIKLGFMVAGVPSWEFEMKKDGALPGFFDTTPKTLPEVSPDSAYQVINKRLSAYSLTPQNNKNLIDLEKINQIHRKIKRDNNFVNYRILIDEIIKELERGDFDILKYNYIEISENTLNEIRQLIRERGLNYLFDRILKNNNITSEENKIRCFNVMIQLYNKQSMGEDSPGFLESKYHFHILRSSDIIWKGRENGILKWVLAPRIKDLFDAISQKYNFFPEDYIKKVFGLKELKSPLERSSKEDNDILKEILSDKPLRMTNSIVKLLRCAWDAKTNYDSQQSDEFDNERYEQLVKTAVSSLSNISRAIFNLEDLKSFPQKDEDVLKYWQNYWFCPGSLANFINEVFYSKDFITKKKLVYVDVAFKESYDELVSHLKEDIKYSMITIPYSSLKKKEIEAINNSRREILSDAYSYFDETKKLNDLLEKKLRKALFNHLNLIYGSNVSDRLEILGPLRDKIISKRIDYNNAFFNEFQNLNRGEYKQLFQITRLRKDYLKALFSYWDNGEIESFLDIFCSNNITTSHNKTQEITSGDQRAVYDFTLKSIDVLKMINLMYTKLLNDHFYYRIESDSKAICYFSIPGRIDHENIRKINHPSELHNSSEIRGISVSLEELNEVYNKLKTYVTNDRNWIIDLEDLEYIYSLFSLSYEKFMAIIGLLLDRTRIKNDDKLTLVLKPYFGSEISVSLKTH